MGTAFIKEPFGKNVQNVVLDGSAALEDLEISNQITFVDLVTDGLSAARTLKLDPINAEIPAFHSWLIIDAKAEGAERTLTLSDGTDVAAATIASGKTNRLVFLFDGDDFLLFSNTQLD